MNQHSLVRGDTVNEQLRGHRFRMHMHMDGCHWYRSTFTCIDEGCRAAYHTYDERSPSEDPWSLVWMEPAYEEVRRDEKGRFCKPYTREVRCDRCSELQDGAEPVSTSVYVPG